MRIVHVAQDAAIQRALGGVERAANVVREHAGRALDPEIAAVLADNAAEILALDAEASAWGEALAAEPAAWLSLEGDAIDRALAAIGDFADLASPYLAGHSAGVAALAEATARRCRFDDDAVATVRRAASVHDIGRIATPVSVWHRPGPLTPDDWEQVRLHAYHSERVLVAVALARPARTDRRRPSRAAGWLRLPPGTRMRPGSPRPHGSSPPSTPTAQ